MPITREQAQDIAQQAKATLDAQEVKARARAQQQALLASVSRPAATSTALDNTIGVLYFISLIAITSGILAYNLTFVQFIIAIVGFPVLIAIAIFKSPLIVLSLVGCIISFSIIQLNKTFIYFISLIAYALCLHWFVQGMLEIFG